MIVDSNLLPNLLRINYKLLGKDKGTRGQTGLILARVKTPTQDRNNPTTQVSPKKFGR